MKNLREANLPLTNNEAIQNMLKGNNIVLSKIEMAWCRDLRFFLLSTVICNLYLLRNLIFNFLKKKKMCIVFICFNASPSCTNHGFILFSNVLN